MPFNFSSDGQMLAMVNDDGGLDTLPLARNNFHRIVAPTKTDRVVGVSWSPDGRSLVYTVEHRFAENSQATDPNAYHVNLRRINVSGSSKPDLLHRSKDHSTVPEIAKWSPFARIGIRRASGCWMSIVENGFALRRSSASATKTGGRTILIPGCQKRKIKMFHVKHS